MATSISDSYEVRNLALSESDAMDLWRQLKTAAAVDNPFATPEYLSAISESPKTSCVLWIVFRDENPILGLPVYETRRPAFRTAPMPPLVPYTPLLSSCAWSDAESNRLQSPLDALLEALHSHYDAVALHLSPTWSDPRTFSWRRWRVSPLATYIVDLPPDRPPLERWSKNNRRDFRHFKDRYELLDGTEHLESVADLVTSSYARHGRSLPVDRASLVGTIRSMSSSGLAHPLLLAESTTGKPAAGVTLLADGESAAYWIAGSIPGPAMTVLMGHLFHLAVRLGVRRLDLVGANTPSIAEFKRRFGGALRVYLRAINLRNPALRLIHHMRPVV